MDYNCLSDMDYNNLRDLLADGKWREADRETLNLVLKITNREKEEFIYRTYWQEFPCTDLHIIDQLWVKYSSGHFGFSIQRNIWKLMEEDAYSFGEKLGWVKDYVWAIEKDLIFNLDNSPKGHLPFNCIRNYSYEEKYKENLVKLLDNYWGHGNILYAFAYLYERVDICNIDLPEEVRSQVAIILNESLASTLDLKTQVKQADWNVKGLDFDQLHELFDEMATELEKFVDLIPKRIAALGGYALGTARIAAEHSILPEYPFDIADGLSHVTALAERYAAYAKLVRDAIDKTGSLGDADTANLYKEVSRAIDKRLSLLKEHLQA